MIDRCTTAPLAARVSSLFLDYGADAQECADDSVEISEHGMQVRSRWKFEIGTELSLAFVCGCAPRGQRFSTEALVVSCEPDECQPGLYVSTLLFLDFPEPLRRSLRGTASR